MITLRFLLISIFFVSSSVQARGVKESVSEKIRPELNLVLKEANQLHQALFHRDADQLDSAIVSMMSLIEQAEDKVVSIANSKNRHILQVLRSIHSSLVLTREFSGVRKSEKLKSVFSDVVQIATNYRLDRYRLFFCPKDRTVWLQKGWKAQHPFDRDRLKHCGAAIR